MKYVMILNAGEESGVFINPDGDEAGIIIFSDIDSAIDMFGVNTPSFSTSMMAQVVIKALVDSTKPILVVLPDDEFLDQFLVKVPTGEYAGFECGMPQFIKFECMTVTQGIHAHKTVDLREEVTKYLTLIPANIGVN